MPIFSWDASHYDWDRGSMDLGAAQRDGIVFMTHKVSEGLRYADPRFAEFGRRARAAGIPLIGGYCVNRRGDQKPQVDWFIKQLDLKTPWWRDGDFVVQLDCERWSYAAEPTRTEIRAWCDYFMTRTGGHWRPIVYAPRWVYGDSLAGLGYPLWASNYGSNPATPYRQAYPGDGSARWNSYSGQTPTILQFGSRTIVGAQRTCDANAFRGTLDQLRALVTGDDMTPAQFLALLNDPGVARLMRALPWQYVGGGIPIGKSTLGVLNDIHSAAIEPPAPELTDEQLVRLAELIAEKISIEQIRRIVREEIDRTKLGSV